MIVKLTLNPFNIKAHNLPEIISHTLYVLVPTTEIETIFKSNPVTRCVWILWLVRAKT